MTNPIFIRYARPESIVNGTIGGEGLLVTAQQMTAEVCRRCGRPAWDVNNLVRGMLPDWYSAHRKLNQTVCISDFLRNHPPGDERLQRAFACNRTGLVDCCRLLVEIGIEPDELPDNGSEEVKFFKRLYADFVTARTSGVRALRKAFAEWADPQAFRSRLERCRVGRDEIEVGAHRAFYFQGFYYIRPIQKRFFDAVRSCGVPVYFLVAFDEAAPDEYEVWRRNPLIEDGVRMRVPTEAPAAAPGDPVFIKFRDNFAFVRHLRELPGEDELRIFAPMTKPVREILETFFPQTDERESLLSYPLGRYLMSLYAMWNDKKGLVLMPDAVRTCLSTGWAASRWSGEADLLALYDASLDYFKDCRTVVQWRTRARLLKNVVERVVGGFGPDEAALPGERWRHVVGSPLLRFGAFNLTTAQVDRLTAAIESLTHDAELIFPKGGGGINLKRHFQNIQELLRTKADGIEIRREERQIVEKFKARMAATDEELVDCHRADLATAMSYYLGGCRDDEDAGFEGRIGFVRGLTEVEAAYLLEPEKTARLCFCGGDALPGRPLSPPWPLSREMLDFVGCPAEVSERLRHYLYFLDSPALASRYLWHLALNLPKLEASWTATRGEREINPSIFLLTEMKRRKASPIERGGLLQGGGDAPVQRDVEWNLSEALDRHLPSEGSPVEVRADRRACRHGWRLLYDYGLGDHPSFTSGFHMQFLLTMMTFVLAEGAEKPPEVCKAWLDSIYPSFREVEKAEVLAFARRHMRAKEGNIDVHEMSDGGPLRRLYLHFIDRRGTNSLLGKRGATMGCVYCPHNEYCIGRYLEEEPEHERGRN